MSRFTRAAMHAGGIFGIAAMSYTLRNYQSESCTAAWDYLCRNAGNPVIVLPTGAGKSLVIAELCRAAVQQFSGRVMVLAHRKELLEQNAEKIKSLLPLGITCGLYSAGLRRFAMDDSIICAGIQSVYKKAADFGRRHLVIIDEVHLVPDDNEGMYRKFINDLAELNPRLKIIGLTATPYRTSTGTICGPEKLFNGVCYSAKIPALIADGFLCPVTTTTTKELYDTANLHIRGGEFIASEVESLFDDDGKTREACVEIVEKCHGRKSILVFSSGVQHAEHIAKIIESFTGEQCGTVTGNTTPLERAATLAAFKEQRLRWLVNVDVLTTGYDAPCVDAIAVLRATQSPGLFAQICGRGFRLHPFKQDCLIVDYGNNIKRHGPIDSDSYGQKSFSKPREIESSNEPGEGKKQCPACECWVAAATKVCPGDEEKGTPCGWLFSKIDARADSQSQILAKPEKWKVISMHLSRHRKRSSVEGAPDTLRVSYQVHAFEDGGDEEEQVLCATCGKLHIPSEDKVLMPNGYVHYAKLECIECGAFIKWLPKPRTGDLSQKEISEWICLEHDGFAGKKAWKWVKEVTDAEIGDPAIESIIDLFQRGALAPVYSITTMQDGKWHRIIERELGSKPQYWQEPLSPVGFDEWGQPVYEEVENKETWNEISDDIPF